MRRRRRIVPHDPMPAGSISLTTLLLVRERVADAEFCDCDSALGEHLRSVVDGGGATIHFYPDPQKNTITVLHISTP